MKTQSQIDAAYLREYVAFGSSAPVTVAECLHKALVVSHGKSEFETVVHLQRISASLAAFVALFLDRDLMQPSGGEETSLDRKDMTQGKGIDK